MSHRCHCTVTARDLHDPVVAVGHQDPAPRHPEPARAASDGDVEKVAIEVGIRHEQQTMTLATHRGHDPAVARLAIDSLRQ